MERCAGSNLTGIKLVGDHHVPAGEKSVIINTKDRDYTADTINVDGRFWSDKQIFYNNFDFDIKSDFLIVRGLWDGHGQDSRTPSKIWQNYEKKIEFPEIVFQ